VADSRREAYPFVGNNDWQQLLLLLLLLLHELLHRSLLLLRWALLRAGCQLCSSTVARCRVLQHCGVRAGDTAPALAGVGKKYVRFVREYQPWQSHATAAHAAAAHAAAWLLSRVVRAVVFAQARNGLFTQSALPALPVLRLPTRPKAKLV
jgi:hypothetical protein